MSGPNSDSGSKPEDGDPKKRRPSGPAVVGPFDVGDEVKEVLRAAFDAAPPQARAETTRAPESAAAGAALDETGPVDVLGSHVEEIESGDEVAKERRRFRDIVRDHDTRIKSQSSVVAPASVPGSTATSKTPGTTKKRVVITDEEVETIKRSAPREGRDRKKSRRKSSDEVTRLPNRRWWSRTADGRWRLRWYSVLGLVIVGGLVVLLLLTSPLMSIRNIRVEGNVYTNQDRLDEVLSQLKGDAILTADLHGATRQIEAIPWVRKARISMHLPSRIVVQIDERSPVAFFRAVDGFIRVVDREGRVLDVIEGDPVDYVRIIGTGPNLGPGDFVQQPFQGAVQLLGALPTSLAERLVSATVSPEGEISLQLRPNLLIIFGQPSDFQVKLVAVINEMKRQGSRSYTVIDVSTGEPNVR